ncbi:MAG: asparaginase [Anaerolineae bacterium]
MMQDTELVQVLRGDALDCVHRGHVVLLRHDGEVISERGDSQTMVFMRSLAKPFQALAVVESGTAQRFDITSAELALMCGSHNGSTEQTHMLEALLHRIGVQVSDLHCGTLTPIDRKTAEQLTRDGQKPTALNHPCSGKHTGMLALCKTKGWEIADYTHADHPAQQYISQIVRGALRLAADDFHLALDGCSVPTYGVPLLNVALAFADLGTAMLKTENSAARTVALAMHQHPLLMSGQRRMDSALMLATNGRVIAKDGTEGVFGCAVPERGVGLALKISDGSNRAIMPIVTKVLRDFDLITADEAAALTVQFPLDIKIHTGEIAGEMRVLV